MFQKLNRQELDRFRTTASYPEYAEFLSDMRKGDGGRITVAEAGVGRQTIKNRLNSAAAALGMQIKFVRSRSDDVVFEVIGK
jgi:hypothetical protein